MTQVISAGTEKRLKNEIKDLLKNKIDFIQAIQDEKDRFIFYFLLKGDKTSDYKGGYYIGKILLPLDYPTKPGDFMILTPNGRFTTDHKICLTNTGYHSESWNPLWSIRNVLLGIYSIWMDDKEHGISHIKDTPAKRREFAKDSMNFNRKHYKDIICNFDQFVNSDGNVIDDSEQAEKFKQKKEKKDTKDDAKEENIKSIQIVKPVVEQIVEPIIKQDVKPVVEQIIKHVVEPVVQPVVEQIIEQIIEPVVEPIIKTKRKYVRKVKETV